MTSIRVLIIDDDPVIRDTFRRLIDHEPDMQVVGTSSDGSEGIDDALATRPDVVLLDVQMPGMSGLETLKMLMSQPMPPRVIMLTMFDNDDYVYRSLRGGAAGFLLKNSSPAAILDALRGCRDTASIIAPEITQRLIAHLAPVRPDPRLRMLTRRERETLVLIAQGMSNAQLAESLFVTETTARTYVSRIMTKVGATHRTQLVVLAYENRLVTPS